MKDLDFFFVQKRVLFFFWANTTEQLECRPGRIITISVFENSLELAKSRLQEFIDEDKALVDYWKNKKKEEKLRKKSRKVVWP